jgi:hypothetical protein
MGRVSPARAAGAEWGELELASVLGELAPSTT